MAKLYFQQPLLQSSVSSNDPSEILENLETRVFFFPLVFFDFVETLKNSIYLNYIFFNNVKVITVTIEQLYTSLLKKVLIKKSYRL